MNASIQRKQPQKQTFPFIIGLLNIVFGALFGLLSLGVYIFLLIVMRSASEAAGHAGVAPLVGPLVGGGTIVLILFGVLELIDRLLQLISGIGLVMNRRWGGVLAILFGAYHLILKLGGLIWVIIALVAVGGFGSGWNVLSIIFPVIGIIYGILNIMAGIRVISVRPHKRILDIIPPVGGGDTATTQQEIRLPQPEQEVTRQFPGAVKRISAQIVINGRQVREEQLNLRDALGKPMKNLVGRGNQCQILVNIPSVSEEHCCISEDNGRNMIVIDMGSRYGTFVERCGRTLRVEKPTALFSGDKVMLGPYAQLIIHEINPTVRGVRVGG